MEFGCRGRECLVEISFSRCIDLCIYIFFYFHVEFLYAMIFFYLTVTVVLKVSLLDSLGFFFLLNDLL